MKKLVALMIISLMLGTGYVSAIPLLDGAANFLTQSAQVSPTERVDEAGMTLFALASLVGKLREGDSSVIATIDEYSRFLVDAQNPDGGWGYYKGSISSVPSTAYAVIGLSKVEQLLSSDKISIKPTTVQASAYQGVVYLRNAFNGEGWGYVAGSPTEFYPTVMAVWALGVAGYGEKDYYVFKGVSYLENATPKDAREMALRLIAFYYVGHTSPRAMKDLSVLESEVLNGELKTKDMALAVYALSLYRPESFDTAKALAMLEGRAVQVNDTYSWKNEEMFYSDAVLTSAYATLPFSGFIRESRVSLYETLQSLVTKLESAQTPSGDWTFNTTPCNCEGPNQEDAKLTYYATLALMKWKGADSEPVRKAVQWAKGRLNVVMGNVRLGGRITTEYYYVLKLLLVTNSLTPDQKKANIELIKSLQLPTGAWRGYPAGSQPLQTAMALDLLVSLGAPKNDTAVVRAKTWLLSVTPDGWGVYLAAPEAGYMVTKDVVTTAFAINALAPISTKEELEPHVKWLLEQRSSDGGWAVIKEYYQMYGDRWVAVSPSVEPTILATYALMRAGYDVSNETTEWLLSRNLNGMPLYQLALALSFLADRVSPELPSIYSVTSLFYTGGHFLLEYDPLYSNVIPEIAAIINGDYHATAEPREGIDLSNQSANYILIGTYDAINVREFNPLLNYSVRGDLVEINGKGYLKDGVVMVIPGRTKGGRVLAIIATKKNYRLVEALFRTSLIKYLGGHYVVLRAVDVNGDGKIELSEIYEVDAG